MSGNSTPPSVPVRETGDPRTFEESLEALHQIVAQLETESLSLDDTIRKFREGSVLAAECLRQIDEAELRVTELAMETSPLAVTGTSDQQP